jgi:hypothetical protein
VKGPALSHLVAVEKNKGDYEHQHAGTVNWLMRRGVCCVHQYESERRIQRLPYRFREQGAAQDLCIIRPGWTASGLR